MKPDNKIQRLMFLTGLLVLLMTVACEYDKGYEPVWQQDVEVVNPKITDINPESASGGIIEIQIEGEHFSQDKKNNFVYFGADTVQVTSASESLLVVKRPIRFGGSLMIKLAVRDLYETTEYGPYQLEQGIVDYPNVDDIYAITVDKDENLYAHQKSDQVIYKITPSGETTAYGTLKQKTSDIKMGPDGYLYLQRDDRKEFYRIAPGGGDAEQFTMIITRVSCFDFDESGYIYSGSSLFGLVVTNPDGTNKQQIKYTNLIVKSVRVFNDFVYVAVDTSILDATFGKEIWKYPLLGNGELGEKTVVLDWAETGSFSDHSITDLTFSEDGDMYISTESESNNSDPVLIVHPDGTFEPLFPGVLKSPVTQLFWGTGNYIFIITTKDNIVNRVIAGKKGAPYYGRL